VHELVCNQLERFVQDVVDKKSPRLVLALSSRIGKSEIASNSLPAWVLGNHPNLDIVLASYSDELPMRFSRSVRAQLQSPEYHTIFPSGARLAVGDAGAKAWSTVQGGGFRATGVGGGLLGFGAHIAIVDDAIKDAEEADNASTLDKVWDWVTSILMSRLHPGGGVIVIAQRMAVDDIIGRIKKRMAEEKEELIRLRKEALTEEDNEEVERLTREADELDTSMDNWHIVEYPALAVADEYLSNEGEIVRAYHESEIDQKWRLLRRQGEALHPERYTRSFYLKVKRANPQRFAAMYQLQPIAEGAEYFVPTDFQRYAPRELPHLDSLSVYCAWDLAIGTKQSNDYTVGIAVGVDHEGRHWFLDRVKGRFPDLEIVAPLIIGLHKQYNAIQTGTERTHLEMALGPVLKRHMLATGDVISLAEGKEALKPIADKKARARTLQSLCRAGKVYVPVDARWDDFVDELLAFPSTAHDDSVDAAAWAALLASRYGLPNDPKTGRQPRPQKSWMDELLEEIEGGRRGDSYMAV
jgi:predicted phage terminase large subunit-like protein